MGERFRKDFMLAIHTAPRVPTPGLSLAMLAAAMCVLLVCIRADAGEELGGEQLYQRHCSGCHGPTGRGDGVDAVYFARPPRDLSTGFLAAYPADELVRRIRDGRALRLELDPEQLAARVRDVEDILAHLERLPRIDWKTVETGWDLYASRCQQCHGPYGKPPRVLPSGVRPPPDLSDPAKQRSLTDDQLIVAVCHGHENMPGLVPRVLPCDANELRSFVRVLSPGFELYSRYCTACHGDDGGGPRDVDAGGEFPLVVFDRTYFEHHDAEHVRARIWHMTAIAKPSMPHFRWALTEDQVRAIVRYLESVRPKPVS
jgi:mono/diheme cytochrome c family protein